MRTNSGERLMAKWDSDPEPMRNDGKGTIILDAGVHNFTWMYDTECDQTAWLQFEGDLIDIVK